MKFKKIVIFLTGAPASGKDTQTGLLAKKLKGKKITISEVFDDFFKNSKRKYLKIKNKTIDLRKEREKRLRGDLISFHFISWLVIETLKKYLPLKKSLIISGGPRSVVEAKAYLNFVKKENLNYAFIFLNISEEEIYKRTLKRKRPDDDLETVKKRIENFKKYTLPAINFLKKRKEIIEINGEGKIQAIHQKIFKSLKEKIV